MHYGQPSRQVLRRAAIRARRMRESLRKRAGGMLTNLALAVGWLMSSQTVYANPTGGEVVGGTASITTGAPGTLNVFQRSNRAIVNWQSFDIAAGETVNFLQPSASSITLNRVLGNDPSAIFGRLNANGTVMLVNPNGVVFGAGARVDVGGIVATTANIRDTDFLAGRYDFGLPSAKPGASIENHGHITIRDSGLAALVAPRVRNSGVIEARLGRVALGAAQSFTLDFHGDGLLSFDAGSAVGQAGDGGPLVVNSGEIRADGGSVLLSARAVKGVIDNVINTSGIVAANTVSGSNGRIVLSGGDAGTVAVSGSIDAAAHAGGQGGTVVATGQHIAVAGTASIDVSGRSGGGEIALGSTGLTDAANPYAHKSSSVTAAAGAQLRADAIDNGRGGNVTLWSTDKTVFAGSISARGGVLGGDGGFAEVSSQKDIGLTGQVDLRAPQGRTGLLLIDPTDLRITDSPSSGSQDSNAGNGSVAAGDADQGSGATLNTVSRGMLESLAGNSNIVLQASGQITVDAMVGGRIDLATTTGHGFTLQSTQTGGIRFVDAATEIRTQGGDITLDAQGIGSTLTNIGRLTTNGGAATLRATGDVQLAGHLNAGGGAVDVRSTVGSITNASASSPLVTGGSVSLIAGAGAIGANGSAIGTSTSQLSLEAGGSMFVSNAVALGSLSFTSFDLAPGTHTYQVGATGLDFTVNDGSSLALAQITQAGGLNLSVASDRSIDAGVVNVGGGTLALSATRGNLTGRAGNALTAGSVTLTAKGSSGANGAIGTSGQALNTTTGSAVATSGSGGTYLANTGALNLSQLSATGASSVTATGTLTAGAVSAGSASLALGSGSGSVQDDGNSATSIAAGSLTLTAGGAIGSSGTRLQTNAGTLSANAAAGGIYATTTATSATLSSITSGNGAIDLRTGGTTTVGNVTSSTSGVANSIAITATGSGSMRVGTVNAGAQGDVSLSTTSGSILMSSGGLITGDTVNLSNASSGSITATTAASRLNAQAGSSSISITQTGAVTLGEIVTPSSVVSVTSSSGDITVGTVRTTTSGQVSLTASGGAILDDANSATRITTGTVTLSASGAIGNSASPVQTRATALSASSTGDLVVTNADATLTSLSITNRHNVAGHAATLQVDSPYLTFDITDTGTSYELTRLVGVPLGSLSFNGDATLVAGQVQSGGSVSLTATQGNITDDGNVRTRITAGSTLTLSAAQGSVGSASAAIGVNASSLALTTRGDLYVSDLVDLSTLTIASTHPDSTTSFGMGITAPSLRLAVSDSAAGHDVQTLTDTSSLSLTFTSDRNITLGNVNVSNTGTARFTSSGGSIIDDGNKATTVLANSVTLSGAAVGASGASHMDVVTGTLAATATGGGVYVQLPMPTGSTNTTSTVTLGTVTATGPVAITALEGDLSLGGFMTATNQPVNLTATRGSILSPSGYSIGVGTGALTLTAGQAIGASSRAIPVTNAAGASVTAQAGTSLVLSASGAMALNSLDAVGGITYTQSSGSATVGSVNAGSGTVSLTASTGSIVDDGSAGTAITGSQVTLSAAQGSVGSVATPLNIAAPGVSVTANGDVAFNDSQTLATLNLARGSTASAGSFAITAGAGQSFDISEDGSSYTLGNVASSTPLTFGFSGQRNLRVGTVDVGAAGSATLATTADIANSGAGASITAGTVSLTAGSAGSVGATGSAISLVGTTALTLSAGRNMYVASDTALSSLAITSTNTTTAVGTASVFGIAALGQTLGIADSGTTQSLDFSGTALGSFSHTTRKNIVAGAITATGDVTLTTSGGGANSNISSDGGSGTIAGNRVLLTATSSTAGGGSIGSSGTALRLDTPTAIVNGSGNVYLDDAQNLTRLEMTLTHGTNTTFGYDVTAGNLSSFAVTDGSTQSLGLAVSGAMDFVYSVDRALSLATIDTGTSTTGSISLTSRSAPTGTNAQINRSSGSLTGGSISLSATGTNGGVGAGATLSTNTKNLSIASGGNVSVSNATTLDSLNLDARHNTSGSSTHSYSISSTGLTFSISDTTGNNAFQLSNIAQSGLDLTVKADRVITASSVNTGAGGKVTLNSNSYVQGGSGANAGSPSITTGDLTLNGGSAFGYQGSTPLYTSANTLASSLSNTLYLSDSGSLTLKSNTVGSSADVATSSGSLLQGSGAVFTTPTLKLSANQSLGAFGNDLATNVRRLTLVARRDAYVINSTDLYSLSLTSTHASVGSQNTISVAADRLALALTDSIGANQYLLSNVNDASGIDFTLSTDVALALGTVDAKAGRSVALYSTGSNTGITNNGSSLLTANSVTLSATGSVGAAGGSGTRMQTDALSVAVSTGANAYLDNAQDLSSLSLTSSQTTGGSAPVYQFTAPALSFDVTDNGTTQVNSVIDTTGLGFALNTRRNQAVGTIDVQRWGTVSLTSAGDILGDASSSNRINAASGSFSTTAGGSLGSLANPLRLTAPIVSLSPTGALNVESDTHIDRLAISTTHPTVTYGGAYSIVSTPMTGTAYQLFSATDDVTGTALTSLTDTEGLAFSFTSDRAMRVGPLDLGSTGTVALTGTGAGGIAGDGDASTQVQAATLSMVSYGGAVGATGAGNSIDATVNSVSATAQGGGVNLALHGRTTLGSLSSTGGVNLANSAGDIALGSINAGGSAVNIDNQGGSILSGSIFNSTTVSLTAQGSIGNQSAISTSANGGGTTTLTAMSAAANGATGSIALSESYTLAASSVLAPAEVTLASGYGLSVGTVTGAGTVSLSSSQGSITGINGSNAVTGSSVALSARYGTGNGIGNSGTRLNVNTAQLTVNTPGSVYITDTADLSHLTLDRTNYSANGSSGTLSIIGSGLTFSATDAGNTTTLTSLSDGTGLAFRYLGVGSIAVGTVNVGASGSALLQAYLSSGDGNITAINGGSLITAGTLTLQAYGTGSTIGTSGTALGTAAGSITANSGTGGMYLNQAGSLTLSNLATSGNLTVNASSGDLTLGTLSHGSSSALSITAAAGSILAGTSTLAGASSSATVTLSAANGIGTELAPVLVNASAGHTVNASVTGTGSLNLSSTGTLSGGLTTTVNNGATRVNAAGNILLTSMSTTTDAVDNDIRVSASAGNITVLSVSGGSTASHNAVDLTASAGSVLAASGGATLDGYDVRLYGASGVGSSSQRVSASGQRVNVESGGGAIYIGASTASVLTGVNSNGGLIDISTSADLHLANASSGGANIAVTGTAGNVDLIAGNIDAGAGSVTMLSTSAGGMVKDDGNANTRVSGASVTLSGTAGVGSSTQAVGTSAGTLTLAGGGTGIFAADGNTSGVTLASVIASGGAIGITTAGSTVATDVRATADATGNHVSISTSSGSLTVTNVSAGATHGQVSLTAAGSIAASGSGPQISTNSVSMSAGADIGSVSHTTTGAGTPVRIDVASIGTLASSGSNAVISVRNDNALTLQPGAISMGSGGSAYLSTAGDMGFVPGAYTFTGNLMLSSDGALVLPAAGISATGRLALVGSTDVRSAGATPRVLALAGDTIYLRSGTSGGATQLDTTTGSIDAVLSAAGALTVNNTGTLTSSTLQTANGDITATSSTGMTAGSVVAGGTGRTVTLTTTTGDLTVGTLNAGSGGVLTLSAANGSLLTASSSLTGSALSLTSGNGIGSAGAAFDATGMAVTAQVTGTGGIYLGSTAALTLGALTTHNGDIAVTTAGNLDAGGSLSAGLSGNVSLTATAGNVTLAQTFTNNGADTTRSRLTVQGNQIVLDGGSVVTSGAQGYTGAVSLGANTTLSGLGVAFSGTVDGAFGLTVDAGSGAATFGGAVGGSTRLGALTVNSSGATSFGTDVRAASVSTDAAGSLQLNGGTVDTTGTQSYGERAVLGANTTLTATTVTLSSGADATTAGGQSLTIAGNAVTGGALGANQALSSVTVSGTGSLGGNVTTTGAQNYTGATTLTTHSALSGVGVGFGSTLDGAHDLTINAGSGVASFAGAVGGSTRLGALTVNSSGATSFGAGVRAASVSTDAAGSLQLNGGTVDTTGAQSYGERAVLGANTTLTATTVMLSGGADATTAGGQSLTIAGNAVTGGALGGNQALDSVTVSGSSTLAGNTSVTTTGNQTYSGAVTLGSDHTLITTAGRIAFGSTIDGTHSLTLENGAGDFRFDHAVGGTTRLGAIVIRSSGETHFAAPVRAASLTTDAPGTLVLASTVDTTGIQTYGELAVLASDVTLTGSSVRLLGGADAGTAGGRSLTITGDAELGGPLGANQALSAVAVSGNTTLTAGGVTTTGDQHYGGAVALGANATLASSGGSLVFGSTIDSAAGHDLSLRADTGSISAAGDVGATSAPGALTLRSGTFTTFNGSVRAGSIVQTAGGGLTRFGGALTAQGTGGLELNGHSFAFDAAVTAGNGAITLANTDAAGTVSFAHAANVQSASGFTQTGGAAVHLPANLSVSAGPVAIEAPAQLPSGAARIATQGDITITGLRGPATALTMTSGTGRMVVGQADADPEHKIEVASLTVPSASSASMYGSLGGMAGPMAATRPLSPHFGVGYTLNDTPWGPLDTVATLAATTVPRSVIPSTPGALSLFTRAVTPGDTAPDALAAFDAPKILTVSLEATPDPAAQTVPKRKRRTEPLLRKAP